MLVTAFTREALANRRMHRDMVRNGYQLVEGPWEIYRGARWREVITDVAIHADGKSLWVKTAETTPPPPQIPP
jgi:hypothetical protein